MRCFQRAMSGFLAGASSVLPLFEGGLERLRRGRAAIRTLSVRRRAVDPEPGGDRWRAEWRIYIGLARLASSGLAR